MREKKWFIYWKKIDPEKMAVEPKPKNVLYQIIGFHSIYGPNSLLYIGRSMDIKKRLIGHDWWIKWEQEEVTIKIGIIGEFISWSEYEKWVKPFENHKKDDNHLPKGINDKSLLNKIERLLIFNCAPSYNGAGLADPDKLRKVIGQNEIRVFNVGNSAPLPREISSRAWL